MLSNLAGDDNDDNDDDDGQTDKPDESSHLMEQLEAKRPQAISSGKAKVAAVAAAAARTRRDKKANRSKSDIQMELRRIKMHEHLLLADQRRLFGQFNETTTTTTCASLAAQPGEETASIAEEQNDEIGQPGKFWCKWQLGCLSRAERRGTTFRGGRQALRLQLNVSAVVVVGGIFLLPTTSLDVVA